MTVRLPVFRMLAVVALFAAFALSGAVASCGDHREGGRSFVTVR